MHRKFIAAVIAATILIAGASAAPARADTEDIARALAGIAALALITKAIRDRNDDNAVTHNRHLGPLVAPGLEPYSGLRPRPLPDRVARKYLPGKCVRRVETRNGIRRVLGARCLERNYSYTSQLPRDCAREIWTERGYRWAYGARCLRKRGYEIARS